jgi:Reverse transcriptase (RNA-dependent DNA polymerase)
MAIDNIAAWGDTDVFPLPPENHAFFDRADDVVELLDDLHTNFQDWVNQHGPINESALAMVGYTAFRWVTQVDPLWNAYLLGLVLAVAPEIETARIPVEQGVVFSYRYAYDPGDHRLFSDGAWRAFNERSIELAKTHEYVLACDIADFYARIYHHRLENSLLFLPGASDVARRIDQILKMFAGGTSYGLPVGGPAARILSELLLNRVDRLLLTSGIVFCRFADDYHLFTDTQAEAYDALRFLTEKLLQNEGLTLQRAKTRIISSRDFRLGSEFEVHQDDAAEGVVDEAGESSEATPPVGDAEIAPVEEPAADTESGRDWEQLSFLALSLRFDPYSPTADEDYEALKDQVSRFDVVGMLTRELSKSRIHMPLTRRLVQAIRYLEPDAKDGAVRTLVDNLDTLSPVLPNVLRAAADLYDELGPDTQAHVIAVTQKVLREKRYYISVPVNLGYAVRLLGKDRSDENQALLAQLFEDAPHFVQRDIVLIMARWRATYWLSDQRAQFSRQHPWVQRALLIASYVLADEGSHWRRQVAGQLSPFDALVRRWMSERVATPEWEVPL